MSWISKFVKCLWTEKYRGRFTLVISQGCLGRQILLEATKPEGQSLAAGGNSLGDLIILWG